MTESCKTASAYCDKDHEEGDQRDVECECGRVWQSLAVAIEQRCEPIDHLIRAEDMVLVHNATKVSALSIRACNESVKIKTKANSRDKSQRTYPDSIAHSS